MRHDGCVKLEWAYVWRCELCGKRHFQEVVIVEPSEAELTDIREHNESMQGDSDGDAVGVISLAIYTVLRTLFAVEIVKLYSLFLTTGMILNESV
jgi:hypothetical protein